MKTGIFKTKPEKNKRFLLVFIMFMLFVEISSIIFTFPCKIQCKIIKHVSFRRRILDIHLNKFIWDCYYFLSIFLA